MRRVAPLLALLALSTVLASPVAAATDGPAAPVPSRSAAVTSPDDVPSRSAAVTRPGAPPDRARLSSPANTTIEISLRPNRSARWRVTMTYALDSPNETAAFRQYAESYRNDRTTVGPSADLFRRIVDAASAATGRRMTVRDVSRGARVGESTGSVSLSFVWTNMLERTGNRTIRLGDAVSLPANRTWIGTLGADQTLVVRTPEGYSIVGSDGPPFELRNNSVVISGPARIDGNFRITYRRAAPNGQTGGTPWGLLAGVVVAVAVVAGAIYVRRRRAGRRSRGTAPTPDDRRGPEAPDAEGDDAPDDGGRPASDGTDAAVEPELLSDEERVERLLRANGGRMKQAAIVKETGWSDAKVSQLLSSMADDGRIDKLRLGRENLISLPEDADDGADRDDRN